MSLYNYPDVRTANVRPTRDGKVGCNHSDCNRIGRYNPNRADFPTSAADEIVISARGGYQSPDGFRVMVPCRKHRNVMKMHAGKGSYDYRDLIFTRTAPTFETDFQAIVDTVRTERAEEKIRADKARQEYIEQNRAEMMAKHNAVATLNATPKRTLADEYGRVFIDTNYIPRLMTPSQAEQYGELLIKAAEDARQAMR